MNDRTERLTRLLSAKRAELFGELRREFGERIEIDAQRAQDEAIEIGDRSVLVLGQDIAFDRLERKRRDLRLIDDALARLAEGSYGVCDECEADIGEERLEILPFAARCVDCEHKREVEERRVLETTGRGFRSGFRDVRDDSEEPTEEDDGED